MGTTKSRKTRRNDSRPVAFSFLSNLSLGNEAGAKPKDNSMFQSLCDDLGLCEEECSSAYINYGYPAYARASTGRSALSLHSTDSSASAEDETTSLRVGKTNRLSTTTPPIMMSVSAPPTGLEAPDYRKLMYKSDMEKPTHVDHHQLTRDDSDRPIASEKIKKKSYRQLKEAKPTGTGILSVLRYYTEKIRHSTGKRAEPMMNRGYVQQQQQLLRQDSSHRAVVETYGHFLTASGALKHAWTRGEWKQGDYDPLFLDNDTYKLKTAQGQYTRSSEMKRELNEQFRLVHPEICQEITLSKIRAIKTHLLEIGKEADLEVSSVAYAYAYFEKLVIKASADHSPACCLLLALKINEAKQPWEYHLLDVIEDQLGIDAEEVHQHEFAVFADLEFLLYIPKYEYMPHFERIIQVLEYKSMEDYLGPSQFYEGEL
ncbi:hypothetical protein BDF14DRAFT_1881164 [Spinellus fusiger]|nr:hypothetical protein BDF14DRAFT_1881164 [Spinellus fusiger]